MQAVILERNKLVGRKAARLLASIGARVTTVDEPAQVAAAIPGATLLCGDTFDGELIAELVRATPGLRGILWTAEPLRRSLKYLVETSAIDHVLARKDFESTPRPWELVMVARRLATAGSVPTLAGYLDWGHQALELEIRSSRERDAATARISDVVSGLSVPKRIAEMVAELAHELIMNAMYDAPIDAAGRPKYAADRKADIVLAESERTLVRLGADGTRLVLQVRDPFGRLERRHVVDGLARGLASGEMDTSHGGAGLGLMVCHNASSAMVFDVVRGRHTEVTAMFELDMNLRELRTQAKSLHFWST